MKYQGEILFFIGAVPELMIILASLWSRKGLFLPYRGVLLEREKVSRKVAVS
jgi:hypothetical protein